MSETKQKVIVPASDETYVVGKNGNAYCVEPVPAVPAQVERDAMKAAHDLIESTLCHVSHGGPTRADGERVLKQLKDVLFPPPNTNSPGPPEPPRPPRDRRVR